ncbi:hypothetical protein N9X05_17920, partial [Paracoccaceae bacterium]|nr:hypothetical protein [Paracoccaceae bacterium]
QHLGATLEVKFEWNLTTHEIHFYLSKIEFHLQICLYQNQRVKLRFFTGFAYVNIHIPVVSAWIV